MRIITVFTAALFLIISSPAFGDHGDEQVQYNIVNLNAEQSRQVANDVMVVTMQAIAQKDNAAEAGRKVNETMKWADQIISDDNKIKHKTLNYQTQPVYHNRVITGWKVSQQLRLQSTDFDSLTAVVGRLQEQLQVASMRFEISPDRRKQEVNTLIVEALQAFREKAGLITQTLKAQDYRLVTVSVNEGKTIMPFRGMVQAEAMSVGASAPTVEAGDSKVRVGVDGTIQLIF